MLFNGQLMSAVANFENVGFPAFDLAALGLPALPLTGGMESIETDTAAIRKVLDKGAAIFVIPFDAGGTVISASVAMTGANAVGEYQCTSVVMFDTPSLVTVIVNETQIAVTYASVQNSVGIPPVTEADNGKVLTVINGAWAASADAVTKEYVQSYVEQYINEALGGDY